VDADGWNRRYATTGLVWTAEPNRFLVQAVEGLVPGRALDLAAGEGRNAVWLARQGWQVTAVDFSAVGLDKARRFAAAAGVTVELVCAEATQPINDVYDLVVVLYLHLPAELRLRAYRNAAAAVAPGGTMLVVGHDTTNLTDGVGGPQDPRVLFTANDVVADLEGTGLTVRRAEAVHRMVTTDDGDRTAIDALVQAERPA
jgi:2-polyprenyl-3-methyl-5-hydroxy-6-metoxy-1,4-benzoquinol methylase